MALQWNGVLHLYASQFVNGSGGSFWYWIPQLCLYRSAIIDEHVIIIIIPHPSLKKTHLSLKQARWPFNIFAYFSSITYVKLITILLSRTVNYNTIAEPVSLKMQCHIELRFFGFSKNNWVTNVFVWGSMSSKLSFFTTPKS